MHSFYSALLCLLKLWQSSTRCALAVLIADKVSYLFSFRCFLFGHKNKSVLKFKWTHFGHYI